MKTERAEKGKRKLNEFKTFQQKKNLGELERVIKLLLLKRIFAFGEKRGRMRWVGNEKLTFLIDKSRMF